MANLRTKSIEWAASALTLPGQHECGDQYIVVDGPNGTLVAAVDGVGHGQEAALAAARAIETIDRYGSIDSLPDLIRRCDQVLRSTRGVVMSLAEFNNEDRTLIWAGIGNVAACLLRRTPISASTPEMLLLHTGVVGRQPPHIKFYTTQIARGDVVVFATDGVHESFADRLEPDGHVSDITNDIISRYGKEDDDALVLVVRYMA